MYIAKVIGTVVATKKDQRLVGYKLLIVSHIDPDGQANGDIVVAVDAVGAGIGEVVLLVEGSSARQALDVSVSPVDAAIVGIVDNMEVGINEDLYQERRPR